MSPHEYHIYPHPTVKKVIFKIHFTNLFMLENRIGDFQQQIMGRFPDSALLIRRQITFADVGPDVKLEEIPRGEEIGPKVWSFKSDSKYVLNITTNSLDISSNLHKSYYPSSGEEGFQDLIRFTLKAFFDITKIPKVKRVGLRYIDESPLPPTYDKFPEWYNSSFPLSKFNLSEAISLLSDIHIERGSYFLHYRESFKRDQAEPKKLILDFDASAMDVDSENCINTLDKLHDLIHREWENTIKQPVRDFMSRTEGGT